MKIAEIFDESRIIGMAGERNTGKTNNLMALLEDFRKYNKSTPIYYYGLEDSVVKWVNKTIKNSFEVSTLEQLSNKTSGILIIDEFQKLNLNDRRYKDLLNQFVNFIYHKNNRVILCSPSLREFNSIIGGKIEKWILKSVKLNSLINGSQLKNIVMNYRGRYKSINDLVVPKNEILVINDRFEQVVKVDYIKNADSKSGQKNIFVKELSKKKVGTTKSLPLPNEKKDFKTKKLSKIMEEQIEAEEVLDDSKEEVESEEIEALDEE